MLVFLILAAVALVMFTLRSEWEKEHPVSTEYEISFDTLPDALDGHRLTYLSDLHAHTFDEGNQSLIERVREAKPDTILVGGDILLVRGEKLSSLEEGARFLGELTSIAPVWFSLGNHELRLRETPEYGTAYETFAGRITELGVRILDDVQVDLSENAHLAGYTVPTECYPRRGNKPLSKERMDAALGEKKEGFTILLAHTPYHEKTYRDWGADLTFSGHYHGGTIVLPFVGSLMSPDFKFFPKVYRGDYIYGKKHLVVGGGLGTHSVNIRFGDRPEIVTVTLRKSES